MLLFLVMDLEMINEKQIKNDNIKLQTYYNNKLPISFNPLDYGKLINKKDNQIKIKNHPKSFVIINQFDNNIERYNLLQYYKNGNLIYNWKDIYVDENTFIR